MELLLDLHVEERGKVEIWITLFMVYSVLATETWPKLQSVLYIRTNQPKGYPPLVLLG